MKAGVPFQQALGALRAAKGVKGRIEVVPTNTDYTVIIDYAHSPDGLENILSSLREIAHGGFSAYLAAEATATEPTPQMAL